MAFNVRNFLTYHPYLTFSDPNNCRFIDPKGKTRGELHPDTAALFRIGRGAFDRLLPAASSREAFDEGFAGYCKTIEEWRSHLKEIQSEKNFRYVAAITGDAVSPDFDEIEDDQILSVFWQLISASGPAPDEALLAIMEEAFLFHVFWEIDNAIVGMGLDGRGAIAAAIAAADALASAIAIQSGDEERAKARREFAYQGAMEKIKRDPKQKEKAFVHECWQQWQAAPSNYPSKAEFARDMLDKCNHLTSQKKIEDWCREWEAKTGTQQAR